MKKNLDYSLIRHSCLILLHIAVRIMESRLYSMLLCEVFPSPSPLPYAVANVGFDTTEEQLGKVLCEVGPIVNLK